MHCGSWPKSRCSSRPTSRLNFWSVPPSSMSDSKRDRVVALHQRVEELVHGDRLLAREALGEIVALEHARDGVLRGELDHARGAERLAPFGVVADLGACGIEHLGRLCVISRGVGLDLLARQRRAHVVAARRVADHRREVADEEDHLVPEVLHLAHLVEDDRVAEMDVGRGGIEAQLDAQAACRARACAATSASTRSSSAPRLKTASWSATSGSRGPEAGVGEAADMKLVPGSQKPC